MIKFTNIYFRDNYEGHDASLADKFSHYPKMYQFHDCFHKGYYMGYIINTTKSILV